MLQIQISNQNNLTISSTPNIQGTGQALEFLRELNRKLKQPEVKISPDQEQIIKNLLNQITVNYKSKSHIVYKVNPLSVPSQIDKLSRKILVNLDKKFRTIEKEFPEKFPRSEIADKIFGFKSLSGFEIKERNDGYVTADNKSFDPSSPLRIMKAEVASKLKRGEKIIFANILLLTSEYKIHLMPKPEMITTVIKRLQDKLAINSDLKKVVAQYKVLLGEEKNGNIQLVEKQDKNGWIVPSIAIYTESKTDAQKLLNALCDLFPDHESMGSGVIPRYNQKIDSLIFYAQGSADIKNLMANDQLEEDKVHFKEESPGQYHLNNPRAQTQ